MTARARLRARRRQALILAGIAAIASASLAPAPSGGTAHRGSPQSPFFGPPAPKSATAGVSASLPPAAQESVQPPASPPSSSAPAESPQPSASPLESPQPSASPTTPPSPAPVVVSPPQADVLLGHFESVHLLSPPSGLVTFSNYDPAIVRVVFNPIERAIDVYGLRSGTTVITVTSESGTSASLSVTVRISAGKAYDAASATITGNPAGAEFVAQVAADTARSVAYPQPHASVNVSSGSIRDAHTMEADTQASVHVPLSITGEGYFPYHQTVVVHMTNLAQPPVAPKYLLVSDFPETITENGTLFYSDVTPDAPARLLYYHYAARGSPLRRVLVKVQNDDLDASLLQLISGVAGPDPNILAVGHESTRRFLEHEASGEGRLFDVPAHTTINVIDQLLPADALVSGLMQVRIVRGAGIRLAVVVQDAGDSPVGPVSEQLLSSAVRHARGIYDVPEFYYDAAYSAGDEGTMLTIGRLPLPNLVKGEVLGGDYGVKQSASVALLNSTDREARIGMWLMPRGGRATATLFIDGRLVQLHALDAGSVSLVRTFSVPAHGFRQVQLVTMPEGGSSYPVNIVFSSFPPAGGGWIQTSAAY